MAAAIHQFRAKPPSLPVCPTVLISASRPLRRGENRHLIAEHQRRYVETLPNGRFERVDSSHFIQVEQPGIVAGTIGQLLHRASLAGLAGAPGPLDGSPPPTQAPAGA